MDIKRDMSAVVTLIICILVTIVASVMAYMENTRNIELQPALVSARKEARVQQKNYEESKEMLLELSQLAGWNDLGALDKVTDYERMIVEMNGWSAMLREYYKVTDVTAGSWTVVGGNVEDKGAHIPVLVDSTEKLIAALKDGIATSARQYDENLTATAEYLSDGASKTGRIVQDVNSKNAAMKTQIDRYLEKQDEILRIVLEGEMMFLDKMRGIESQRDSISNIKKQSEDELQKIAKEGEELQKRLDVMNAEAPMPKDGIDIDGKVQDTFTKGGYVYVDIGRRHCLFPGTVFDVYRLLKNGVPKRIGQLKITDIMEDDLSKGTVISTMNQELVVQPGDYVANAKFDASQKKTFVIVGRLKVKHSNETATEIMRKYGWTVDEKISIYTTYAVLGDDFKTSPEFAEAERLGITLLSERELLQLID